MECVCLKIGKKQKKVLGVVDTVGQDCETKRNMYENWMKKRNVKYKFFTSNNPFFEKFTSCRSRVIGFYTYHFEELKQYEKLLE